MTMRVLRLEWHGYGGRSVWRRVHPCANDKRVFFDQRTGDFHWAFPELRDGELVDLAIQPFDEVPALPSDVHHTIFAAFVQAAPIGAKSATWVGPSSVPPDLLHRWEKFESEALKKFATAWLRERDIDVEWIDHWADPP